MSDKTPMIPPGCEYFSLACDEDCETERYVFGMPDPESDFPITTELDTPSKYERGIIAAVARVAWADEASKYLGRDKDKYEEYLAHANSWAKLGRGE